MDFFWSDDDCFFNLCQHGILESAGNPEIAKLGISQPTGSMEGKEVRFGPEASALWGVSTT